MEECRHLEKYHLALTAKISGNGDEKKVLGEGDLRWTILSFRKLEDGRQHAPVALNRWHGREQLMRLL